MYDQNFINEEVMLHRRVLMHLGQRLGVNVADLTARDEALSGAVMRTIKTNLAEGRAPRPGGITHMQAIRYIEGARKPVDTFTLLDGYVWSLQALLHKQWDLVALDLVEPGLRDELHEIAVAQALKGIDYDDPVQFEAVKIRLHKVLTDYIRNLLFNTVREDDLTGEDKAAAMDAKDPFEAGPFAPYHAAACRLVDSHWSVLVEKPYVDGNYVERWAGMARDPSISKDLHLSLGIVPRQLRGILDSGEYTLVTNDSSARSNTGAPDTVYFGWKDHFGIGHSPLDAMAHYLATDANLPDEERGIWKKWRGRVR